MNTVCWNTNCIVVNVSYDISFETTTSKRPGIYWDMPNIYYQYIMQTRHTTSTHNITHRYVQYVQHIFIKHNFKRTCNTAPWNARSNGIWTKWPSETSTRIYHTKFETATLQTSIHSLTIACLFLFLLRISIMTNIGPNSACGEYQHRLVSGTVFPIRTSTMPDKCVLRCMQFCRR